MDRIESDIEIKIYSDGDIISLQLVSDDRDIIIGFDVQEAQLLSIMLGEAVTTMLLEKLELLPASMEHIH